MILTFPDLATLRLALTTGAVPPAISATSARAGDGENGSFRVETAEALSRASQQELKKLGVMCARANDSSLPIDVCCWAELLPLQADAGSHATSDRTPVLFELSTGLALSDLVNEILRLGNDRQSFRWLEDGKGEPRALLRVVDPPYYSLLRAIDRIGKADAPAAFVERAPRVWIEWGYTHPFVDHIQPPGGKILLMQAPRQWTLLDDAPFRDIYEVLDFTLPFGPAALTDVPPIQRFQVSPTLQPGGSAEGAELWVLRDDDVEELNRFVQNSDDQLLHRLAFAVGERDGQTTVVVRVRQSRQALPVLVLKGVPYKQYLKLPNLFVPTGTLLHPPLRRDVVRKLLADDSDRVTWLTPHVDNSFIPESLPEIAFRPLADWVEYVLDKDREALRAWIQGFRFDFEGFICADDQPVQPKRAPDRDRKRRDKTGRGTGRENDAQNLSAFTPTMKTRQSKASVEESDSVPAVVPGDLPEVQKRLKALEERFVAAEGGLDNPERTTLWPELAALNAALGSTDDAAICWMNALWIGGEAAPARAQAWFGVEASSLPARLESGSPRGRSWASRAKLPGGDGCDVSGEDLDRLLALEEPAPGDLRALAAHLVCSAGRTPPSDELMRRLNPVQRFLETHEGLLPVRAVWLAWSHLARLAGDDVLGLARARDRLLARLYSNGLRPEQDLPTFLRFGGVSNGSRFRAVGPWLMQLCVRARQWASRQGHDALYADKQPRTAEYIDLLFAFGLARLGEGGTSRQLLQRASAGLAEGEDAHQLLLAGFRYRIEQALAGKPWGGPLPFEQLEYLEMLPDERRTDENVPARYVVDRMRSVSRILEPDQHVDPYRHYHAQADGDLAAEIALLPDLPDVRQVAARVQQLLRRPPKRATGPDARAQVLRAGLDQAPRVGEDFSRELLDLVAPAYDALGKGEDIAITMARAKLLEKALFVAAHFDRVEYISPFVSRFEELVEAQSGGTTVAAVESLAAQCFRGLRKLGMRDEIDRLLTLMADVILQGNPLSSLDGRPDKAAALRSLLQVSAGRYYFGQNSRAEPVLHAARASLFAGEWAARGLDHANLACAYASTVGQGPPELARRRLEELFDKLTDVRDTFTTNAYYSQSQIKVVETVVLAVASDDFTSGSQARRWLDDDEFLVRRRIHRELREMMTR
jgi:hypothetical protein